jgi:hypothetical protein
VGRDVFLEDVVGPVVRSAVRVVGVDSTAVVGAVSGEDVLCDLDGVRGVEEQRAAVVAAPGAVRFVLDEAGRGDLDVVGVGGVDRAAVVVGGVLAEVALVDEDVVSTPAVGVEVDRAAIAIGRRVVLEGRVVCIEVAEVVAVYGPAA